MEKKIKGIKKLNKSISKPLIKKFGIHKAVCTDEYSYRFVDETVTYKLTEGAIEDEWFTEFIEERFGYKVEQPFVMSILHEIGHHKANDNIDGDIYDFCMAEKARINEEMQTADDDYSKVLEWQYFNLPDEIMATQWAVTYAKNHPKAVKKLWRKMETALHTFYLKNDVI